MKRIRTTVCIVALVCLVCPTPAAASSCPGSGGAAICSSIASSDIWLHLMLGFVTTLLALSDTQLALGEEPPGMVVHPVNAVHHVFSGLTMLTGALGRNDPSLGGSARVLFTIGVVSESLAVLDTVVIAARHRHRKRVEKRIRHGK